MHTATQQRFDLIAMYIDKQIPFVCVCMVANSLLVCNSQSYFL